MSDTQVADPLIGTLVAGRYRVRELLVRAERSSAYLAQDERLARAVTIKIVQPQLAADPGFRERFVEEATTLARLTHPHVLATFDQGTHDGLPYLVTEHARGHTLRDILRSRRRLTVVEALAISEQLLAAIAAAHRAGMVHRDIRPEHVLLTGPPRSGAGNLVDSVVKVTDFGLAQAAAYESDGEAATLAGGQPGEDAARGAAGAYTAPEVAAGGPADPRSDVYSAGVVLFEMLTGRLPHQHDAGAGSPGQPGQPPDAPMTPPSRYATGLPPAADQLVLRALGKDPARRPYDAGALHTEVQALRDQAAAAPPVAGQRPPDATVVLSRLPAESSPPTSPPVASDPAAERPAWARLPAPRSRAGAGGGRPGGGESAYVGGRLSSRRAARSATRAARTRQAVVAGGVAAVVLLVAFAGWWVGWGRWMPAPQLVGMPESEAVALAQQEGLRVEFADPRHDEQVAEGHVLSQEPTDRVARGGAVTVTLSLGPEVFPVPDVVGAVAEVAIRQLETLGLTVIEEEPRYSDTVPADRVLALDPPVGEPVAPGDTVTVTISRGRAPIDVPSVVGLHIDQARERLLQEGLTPQVEEVESNEPAGQVLAQDPSPGSGAEAGDSVQLEISQGPPTQPVPDVEGRRCGRAAEILTEAGFSVQTVGAPRGRVAIQSPSAGTGLPPGSEVTIICG